MLDLAEGAPPWIGHLAERAVHRRHLLQPVRRPQRRASLSRRVHRPPEGLPGALPGQGLVRRPGLRNPALQQGWPLGRDVRAVGLHRPLHIERLQGCRLQLPVVPRHHVGHLHPAVVTGVRGNGPAHESMHDYFPYFGHAHVTPREQKLWVLSYEVRHPRYSNSPIN